MAVFKFAALAAVVVEFIAVLLDNMVLLDCSIVSLLTICLMWFAVAMSDRRSQRMAQRARRRKVTDR